MSNSEPSAIVLQGIACMRGIVQLSVRIEKTAGGLIERAAGRLRPAESTQAKIGLEWATRQLTGLSGPLACTKS